jgi:predicted signal transduction protein with EAL and GGDEF domain
VALYRAKAERRSALRFFEAQMDQRVRERAQMERELRSALTSGSLTTVYQPTVDLQSRQVVGFEAMPHWVHPTLGEIPAARFIPIAEETGLIHELAERLLRNACTTAMRWPDHVTLALDLYPIQLRDRDYKARVFAILAQAGLAAHRLEIEITESALVGLGLTVAAEGINETQQRASLLGSGCVQGQGILFGGPVTADSTAAFFADALDQAV